MVTCGVYSGPRAAADPLQPPLVLGLQLEERGRRGQLGDDGGRLARAERVDPRNPDVERGAADAGEDAAASSATTMSTSPMKRSVR